MAQKKYERELLHCPDEAFKDRGQTSDQKPLKHNVWIIFFWKTEEKESVQENKIQEFRSLTFFIHFYFILYLESMSSEL